jgi:hypothetical protein
MNLHSRRAIAGLARATGRDMRCSPTIRAALVTGTPWLDVFCPGCGTSQAVDLRTIDRHPLAAVDTLVLGLSGWVIADGPGPSVGRPAASLQGTSNNSGSSVEFAGATLRRPFCS